VPGKRNNKMNEFSAPKMSWIEYDKAPIRMTDLFSINMFDDPRWHQIAVRLFDAEIDGQKIGAVLATWNQYYGNFTLNCPEMERLLAALRDGKITAAYVIAVEVGQGNNTRRYLFRQAVNAEELNTRLRNKPTQFGKYGRVWRLAPYEFGEAPF
jgi:hypothetical protein